jgi:hypothetical protein
MMHSSPGGLHVHSLAGEVDQSRCFRGMSYSPAINTKRTSGQAGLDDPPSKNSIVNAVSPSQGGDVCFDGRPIRPLPKRAKHQAMESRTDCWTSVDTTLSSSQWCFDSVLALFSRGPTARTGPSNFTFGSNTSGLASQQMVAETSPGLSQ